MSLAATAVETRTERRKRETRERLLDAALRVFLEKGFDGATTAEIAQLADLGAGTFYLHFQDKRDAYETLARRAAREMIQRWRAGIRPDTPLVDRVTRCLDVATAFWTEDPARARFLLEGGPTFGSEAHLQLVRHLASRMDEDVPPDVFPNAELLATLVVGLAIELGRVIVGSDPGSARRMAAGIVQLVRRMLAPRV